MCWTRPGPSLRHRPSLWISDFASEKKSTITTLAARWKMMKKTKTTRHNNDSTASQMWVVVFRNGHRQTVLNYSDPHFFLISEYSSTHTSVTLLREPTQTQTPPNNYQLIQT